MSSSSSLLKSLVSQWGCCVLIFLACVPMLEAQSTRDNSIRLANLEQEVAATQRSLGSLRLELERIVRNQEQLLSNMKQLDDRFNQLRSAQATSAADERQMQALKKALQQDDLKHREEILREVYASMEKMARQTEASLKSIAESVNGVAGPPATVSFSDDYPREGVSYVVKSGDTLSKIAKVHKSRVRWIQDANRIAVPSDLQTGVTIFVPQGK